jgi:hypothetical protein
MSSVSPPTETLEQQVQRLLRVWRAETAHLSSSTRLKNHPAYQELIALGRPALSCLLRDLAQTLDGHLAPALSAITGVHPVPAEARGRIKQVAEAWLRWAKDNGVQE